MNLFEQTYELCVPSAPVCGPGYGIPSQQVAKVAAGDGSNFEIVYLDPDFDAPSELKCALGLTWQTDIGYLITADAQITRGKHTVIYKHGDLEKVGTNDFGNGYPVYDSVRLSSFGLNNSGVGNESESLAVSVFKDFENGVDVRLGYAWVDAKDVNPMTSSVAFSNFVKRTFYDPEEEVLSPSNYNIEHRFTGVLNYNVNLFGYYNTRFSFFAQSSSGVPYWVALKAPASPTASHLTSTYSSTYWSSPVREITAKVVHGPRLICVSCRSCRGSIRSKEHEPLSWWIT